MERKYIDRRLEQDRRRVYDINWTNERRSYKERRSLIEKRENWQRVSIFSSIQKR